MEEVSKGKRFLGYFIDGIIAAVPYYIIAYFAMKSQNMGLIMVGYLIMLIYLLFRDALFGGQSIGKKVAGYKVVKEDGSSLAGDFMTSLLRNVSLLIPFADPILILMGKQRLGDGWAKTKVAL